MATAGSIYPHEVIEQHSGRKESGSAFLLQPIHPSFDVVFAATKSLCRAKGLRMTRADDIRAPGAIISQVVARICSSQVVIADLTGRNANVFYEVGIGHAIRQDMILLAQKVESVPFDLRHLRLLPYRKDNLPLLRTMLGATIDDVLGSPTEARALARSTQSRLRATRSERKATGAQPSSRDIGRVLIDARVSQGLSLRDAEQATRISSRYLESLESGHFDQLPAPVYARAFLRTYAHYLGLDGSTLVDGIRVKG